MQKNSTHKKYVDAAIRESLANQCGFDSWEEYSTYLLKGKRNIETHGIDTQPNLIAEEMRVDS